MSKYLSAFMIFAVSLTAHTNGPASVLVDNIQPPGGTLYVAFYNATADGSWQDEPLLRLQTAIAETPSQHLEIGLADGRYTARAYLDRNHNGRLDTDKSGKPLEPFAVSLGAGRKKPSIKFSESVFEISPQKREVRMTLRYPKIRHQAPFVPQD